MFASAEPADVAARLAATQRPLAERCTKDKAPEAVGWKTIPSWYVIGDADKVIPPTSSQVCDAYQVRIYHVPGGDHPSMIAHPEAVAAIRDAAGAVDGGHRNRNSVADARRTMEDGHHLSSV